MNRGDQREGSFKVRKGWCLGSEEFRQELLAGLGEAGLPRHSGATEGDAPAESRTDYRARDQTAWPGAIRSG